MTSTRLRIWSSFTEPMDFMIERFDMTETKRILMERDGLTAEEADELMAECREELESGNFSAMQEVLGLEDDYLFDII